ncbi:hypothetical protein OBBRIDRAFT_667770 [Obba rivulosa]|uniref:Uncharacterized protein n=1 Tax=Obba rivulosa TaxID=1052685 RepID=A0A8E2AZC5_9APHY|nr:hypothetical protein OBBRIDRAFT_667770 [Obba rivulosa]
MVAVCSALKRSTLNLNNVACLRVVIWLYLHPGSQAVIPGGRFHMNDMLHSNRGCCDDERKGSSRFTLVSHPGSAVSSNTPAPRAVHPVAQSVLGVLSMYSAKS